MRRFLLWLVLVLFLAPVLLLVTDPDGFRLTSVAVADDDDDNDDDDDDDDDQGSRGRASGVQLPWRPAPPRIAAIVAPAEIVVAQISEDDLARIITDGFAILATSPLSLIDGVIARLRPPSGLGVDAARERIRLIAPAALVDTNHLYRPVEMPCRDNDCLAFEMIGWAVPPQRCEIGGTIGMIDTTVNTEHETLLDQGVEIVSVMSDGDRSSAATHGTAIAALLVGDDESRTPGLLPNAKLIAVEAFHRDRAGDAADVYKIVRGIDQLHQRAVQIVNLSFAGPANALLETAVAKAVDDGMILVAAAGNRGPGASPAYPAAYAGVIAVTAVDRSSRAYRHAGRGEHIAFSAPGVGIWTAASVSGGRFRSGTSYAVPFVSAAIASVLANRPHLTSEEVRDHLSTQSIDLGEAGRDPVFGWGLVKAEGC